MNLKERERQLEYRKELLGQIVYARLNKNLTQNDAAKLTGLSQSAISRIESGESDPRLKTLIKYLNKLHKTLKIVDI